MASRLPFILHSTESANARFERCVRFFVSALVQGSALCKNFRIFWSSALIQGQRCSRVVCFGHFFLLVFCPFGHFVSLGIMSFGHFIPFGILSYLDKMSFGHSIHGHFVIRGHFVTLGISS